MAKQQTKEKHTDEFEYQRFLDKVKRAPELCAVDDRFARQVFDYLQPKDDSDRKNFVDLLAEIISIAAYPSAADRLMTQDKERFPNYKGDGTEAAERIARLFGDAQSFATTAKPKEKKLAKLTFEQQFDLIHFLLCALNFLSNESPFCLPSIEYLTKKRSELIIVASREGEHSVPWIRAIKAKTRDIEIENRWKTGDLTFSETTEPTGEANNENELMEVNDKNEFSTRRKILALLLLLFGRMEVPEDVTDEFVINFIHSITGNSRQNIRKFVYKPTKTKNSKRSVQSLCRDLHFVRNQLSQFGMAEAITSVISEIDCLIEDLEEKSK